MKSYYVYIIKCADESYYTGFTNDLERRFNEHANGVNESCYTYNKRPLELVYFNHFTDPDQAIAFEKQIKKWSRKKKQALIEDNWEKLKELSVCQNDSHYSNYKKG